MTETLERRFDAAFGVERSESERNAILSQRLQRTEADLAALGEAYAEPDLLRMENDQLRQQLRDAGLEPWQLPQSEER
jgi:regulator of replication initiation timing